MSENISKVSILLQALFFFCQTEAKDGNPSDGYCALENIP
jgi:hypothetical protein